MILHWLKAPDLCSSGCTHGSALLHWSSATASYLMCSKAGAPVPCPSWEVPLNSHCNLQWLWKWRPGEGVWFHTPWCSTCWKSYLSLQRRSFPLFSKCNRLEPQSRTNCTFWSHHWYKEAKGWQEKYRKAELGKKEGWHYEQAQGTSLLLPSPQKFHWYYLIPHKRCQDTTLNTWDSLMSHVQRYIQEVSIPRVDIHFCICFPFLSQAQDKLVSIYKEEIA